MKNKKFEEWVLKQVKYYKPFLDINLQDIGVDFNKKTEYLSISFTYPYLEPTILYSLRAVEDWKEKRLSKDKILHELCHIITDPFYSIALDRHASKEQIENERERLTDTLQVIIKNLLCDQ